MLTRDTLFVFLFAIPIYQLLFYTVQLVSFKRSNPSRRYFGLLLLNMTLVLFVNAVHHLGYASWMSVCYIPFMPLLLTLIPVFFLYLLSLSNEDRRKRQWTILTLFIPPVLLFVLNFFTFGLQPLADRLIFISSHFSPDGMPYDSLQIAEGILKIGVPLLLAFQVIIALYHIRALKRAETEAIQQDPGYLAWLQPSWIDMISVSLILFIAGIVLQNLLFGLQDMVAAIIFNVLFLAGGGFAGYFGMKQNALFLQVATLGKSGTSPLTLQQQFLKKEEELKLQSRPPAASMIPLEQAERIIHDLDLLMQSRKPFVATDYTLDDLCEQLDVPRKHLSYVLNDVMGKNFYGVINEYRMQEAIRIIEKDRQKYTIEAIARLVGFNSKSSFYACFRKYTGVTPKEYLGGN